MTAPAAKFRVIVAQPARDTRLSAALAGEPAIDVVATTTEGLRALTLARRLRPDAIVLDAALPADAAFGAARRIMAELPTPIVMAVEEGATRATQQRTAAIAAGAALVVAKPPDPETPGFASRRSGLIAAVRAMAPMRLSADRLHAVEPPAPPMRRAAIVALAASTGGPAAIARVLGELPADFNAPVLVTQHIARGFVDGMVRWLDGSCAITVKLAEHGERLRPSTVYVAGDDRHLTARDSRTIALSDEPPAHGHRPSASVMFRSVAAAFGSAALTAILTGMGRDGIDGLIAVRQAGGVVIAQDEATSAVFGMPKAAIDAGIVDRIVPLGALAQHFLGATQCNAS
jgi:two-component system chemotaxis response regulator CheB